MRETERGEDGWRGRGGVVLQKRERADSQRGGFGCPVVSQQGGDLVVVDVNVDAVHHLVLPAELLAQPTHTDANVKAAWWRLVQT